MPKVTFTRYHQVLQGDGNGPIYKVGETHDLPQSYADKYIRRGYAVPVAEGAVAAPAPVEMPPAEDPPTDVVAMTAAALLDAAENDPAMKNFMHFRAEATKILGDDTPAKKADIIAALQLQAEADAAAAPAAETAGEGEGAAAS